MQNQPTPLSFVCEAAPKRVFKREGKLEINPLLLQAFGITAEDIAETIKSAEEPEAMRDMFAFLSDYATLSDPRTRLSVSGDKLDFLVADLKRRMGRVAEVYRKQAEEHREFGYATASLLSRTSDKARELSNFKGMSRKDKVAFIDAVVALEHTSGSIIPIAFGISDYGREDYWPRKLLAFLRTHGMPGMVRENATPDAGKPNIIFLPLKQAWQMRAKHAYPGTMEPKRTREAMERLRNEMKQGHFEPIPATQEELRSGILTEGKHRLIVAKELGIKQVPIKIIESNRGKPKINWNLNIHEGKIVYMPPEEYMERVNIFNRINMREVLEQERKATERGYRGIGYYPPLSESSYRSILEGIRAGNEMDIPNLVYRNGMVENQEGFHRSLVARDIGIDKIPVQVIGEMPSVFSRALNLNWNQNLTEQVKAINALKGKVMGGVPMVSMIREATTPAPEPADKEFRANPNLINKELAMRSHAGTSFDPEKRGEQEIAEFVSYVQEVYEHLKKHAKTDQQKEYLLTEMDRFQSAFASKYNAKLSAQGGCLSTMIAGPSGFPVRRAEKACSAADKRYEELIEFRDRAEAAILRELKKMAVEEAGGEVEVLKKKIADAERNHEFMVKTNVIVRKKIPDEQKIREIMALAKISEATVREILKPDFMGRVGFPAWALSNDTANIHRMKERLIELEKKEVTPTGEIPFTGGYIIDNREADRVQIIFDQKPSQEVINKLKSEGWRWSPANMAWQRKRTDAAMYSARRITGAAQPAPAVQPAITPVPVPVPAARPEPLAGLEADIKAYWDIDKSIQELQKQFESTGRFPPEYTATREAEIKAYDKIIKYYIDEIRKIPASKGMTYNQILSVAERATLVAIGASPQSVNLLEEIERVLEKKITPERPKPVPVEPELRWVYGTQDGKWHLVGPEDRDYAHGITQERMKTIGPELAKAEYLSPALARAPPSPAAPAPIPPAEQGGELQSYIGTRVRVTVPGKDLGKEFTVDSISGNYLAGMYQGMMMLAKPSEVEVVGGAQATPDIQALFDRYKRSTVLPVSVLASPKFMNDEAVAKDISQNLQISVEEALRLVPQFRAIVAKLVHKEEIEGIKERFGIDVEKEAYKLGIDLTEYEIIPAGSRVFLQHRTIVQKSYELKSPAGYIKRRDQEWQEKYRKAAGRLSLTVKEPEDYYSGTEVTVSVGEPPNFLNGTLKRLLDRGETVEVRIYGETNTIKVPIDKVRVRKLVVRQGAPPAPKGMERPSHIGEIRTFWAYPEQAVPGRVKTAQQIEAEKLLGVDLDNFDVYEFTTWTELVETKHPELKQMIRGHMISRHLKADEYTFVKRFLRGMELPTALQIPGALPIVQPKAPVTPPAAAAKPVQSIQEIKEQVISSIQAAKTVEELQPVLKGIGFLPLPESEKRQVMDAYQNRYSMLMSERPFGAPVKTEEKPKVIGAPTRQQAVEAEQRRRAEELSTTMGQVKLGGAVTTSVRLGMFEPGAMEKAKAEAEARRRIEVAGLPYGVHPVIKRLAESKEQLIKFGSKRGKETVEDLVLSKYVQYCPPGTIVDNRKVVKVPERWWVYPAKLKACMTEVEQKIAAAGAGMVREATDLTPSMRSYIQGATAIRDVIHYFRDGRPPIRGVLYRTRDRRYFVEANDGQIYDSMGWEYIEAQPQSAVREHTGYAGGYSRAARGY